MAENIFDGISYSKGAAVMKNLYHLVGDKAFSLSMKKYFDKYKWSNASLSDLIDIFIETSGKTDLR